MKWIIKIFENSMLLTITTVIAAFGVGLNVWFKKKAMGDPKREQLLKSKFEIYKDMYLQIVFTKRSYCLNKSSRDIDDIIKNYYRNLIENNRDKLILFDERTIDLFEAIFNEDINSVDSREETEKASKLIDNKYRYWTRFKHSHRKNKLESNIKKEYKRLKKRMKYPMHYARYIIANIGFFVMIICTTGLLNASESDISGHSYVVGALLIASIISIIITICNISYIGEY